MINVKTRFSEIFINSSKMLHNISKTKKQCFLVVHSFYLLKCIPKCKRISSSDYQNINMRTNNQYIYLYKFKLSELPLLTDYIN